MITRITIPIEAVAKARPRKGKYGTMYTPTTTQKFEDTVRYFASKEIATPSDDTVRLSIKIFLKRPKRLVWKRKSMPAILCDKKPDIDNYAKSIMDALSGIAYRDDNQIAILHVEKWYCSGDDRPHIDIEIGEPEVYPTP